MGARKGYADVAAHYRRLIAAGTSVPVTPCRP